MRSGLLFLWVILALAALPAFAGGRRVMEENVLADYCNDRGGYAEKVAATATSCDDAAAKADGLLRRKLDAAQASCELEGGNFAMDGDAHLVGNEGEGPVSLQSGCVSLSDGTVTVLLRQCLRCGL